ncbi:unnamed protein product, partial [Ixodes hexagonus]
MIFSVVLPVAALVFISALSAANAAHVNITDGGYENIRVAIAESVPYHPDIVINLKSLIRRASQFLLVATKGNFYFKDVIISIPMTWPNSDVTVMIWEDEYDKAQVQVTDAVKEPATLNPTRRHDTDPNPIQLPLAKLTINRKVHTNFRQVQQADQIGKRIVFAIDLSRSMLPKIGDKFNRITFLKCSMSLLLRHSIRSGQFLGIVSFVGRSAIVQPLVRVNDSDTRERFATVVTNMSLGGGTCIGCGLRDGIKVLEENGTSATGGTIILVSDGEENYKPYIADQLPEVVSKGVIVHTFALGSEADMKLQDVALQTGGTAYTFGDLQTNTIAELDLAFLLSSTWNLDKEQQPVIELGKDTIVRISFLEKQNITVKLIDGSGKDCVSECKFTETDLAINVNLPTTIAAETWKLILEAGGTEASNVTVVVLSTQRDPQQAPIRAETRVRHDPRTSHALIYTRVTKGGYAVLNAKVVATIDFNGTVGRDLLPLLDNGIGPDMEKDDGEYSAYFTNLQGKGRYSVRTDV